MDVTSYLLGKKSGGGGSSDLSEYFDDTISQGSQYSPGWINIIKKIPGTIKLNGTSLSYAFSRFKGEELPKLEFLSNNINDFQNMFSHCNNLKKISTENFNTNNATNMVGMFSDCSSLAELDLENFNTSKVTNMSNMFYNCSNLVTIKCNFDCSSCTNFNNLFYNCTKLANIGTFSNIGKAYLTTVSANYSPYSIKLQGYAWTQESLANIVNGLYDIASAGVQPQKIIMEIGLQNRLTQEQKDIIASRGWTLATY